MKILPYQRINFDQMTTYLNPNLTEKETEKIQRLSSLYIRTINQDPSISIFVSLLETILLYEDEEALIDIFTVYKPPPQFFNEILNIINEHLQLEQKLSQFDEIIQKISSSLLENYTKNFFSAFQNFDDQFTSAFGYQINVIEYKNFRYLIPINKDVISINLLKNYDSFYFLLMQKRLKNSNIKLSALRKISFSIIYQQNASRIQQGHQIDYEFSEGPIQPLKNVVKKKISKIIFKNGLTNQEIQSQETKSVQSNTIKVREENEDQMNQQIEIEQSIQQSQNFNYPELKVKNNNDKSIDGFMNTKIESHNQDPKSENELQNHQIKYGEDFNQNIEIINAVILDFNGNLQQDNLSCKWCLKNCLFQNEEICYNQFCCSCFYRFDDLQFRYTNKKCQIHYNCLICTQVIQVYCCLCN